MVLASQQEANPLFSCRASHLHCEGTNCLDMCARIPKGLCPKTTVKPLKQGLYMLDNLIYCDHFLLGHLHFTGCLDSKRCSQPGLQAGRRTARPPAKGRGRETLLHLGLRGSVGVKEGHRTGAVPWGDTKPGGQGGTPLCLLSPPTVIFPEGKSWQVSWKGQDPGCPPLHSKKGPFPHPDGPGGHVSPFPHSYMEDLS